MKKTKIFILCAALMSVSCAGKELKKEIDIEVAAQPGWTPGHSVLGNGLEKVMTAPTLTDAQKDELADVMKTVMIENLAIEDQSYRLKGVLFETIVAVPYRKEKVEELRRRLEDVSNRRLSVMFMALARTEKIIGYLTPEQRHQFYRQLLPQQNVR